MSEWHLPELCVAFALFFLLLGMRIISRRERWAISLARIIAAVAAIAGLPAVFILTFFWRVIRSHFFKGIPD